MQRLLAFPPVKFTATKEYAWSCLQHEFNTALTWIFLTHLRRSRAVFEQQLKPRASYFMTTRLSHTSDYYSMYKDKQKSCCDCSKSSNLSTNASLVLWISLEAPKDRNRGLDTKSNLCQGELSGIIATAGSEPEANKRGTLSSAEASFVLASHAVVIRLVTRS